MIQRGGRHMVGFGLGAPAPTTFGLGEAALPSGDAALHLVRGERGAILEVVSTVVMRSALAAGGLAIAGFRGRHLVKATLGAMLGIEAGVLAWAWKNKDA